MIPVRVASGATAHVVRTGFRIGSGHPLAGTLCPVCDEALQLKTVALVYVGTMPEDREGAYWTGGAVAVHDACAAPNGANNG